MFLFLIWAAEWGRLEVPTELDIGNIVEWKRAVFLLKNKRSEAWGYIKTVN